MGEQNWTKIVIPSGTVDSSQNAIIEIPVNLKGSHIVIAKNRVSDDGESQGDEVELEVISDKEKEMIESIQNYEDERKRLVIAPVRQKYRLVDQMEYVETGVLRKDITDFQEARRKLVFDVHSIISTLPDINKVISRR
ncbi:uncharacterized protein LOC130898576 [Diorhabda carinulata]|uniref:uncharacterized protein LOC130898576 n=1 Tax=Diorhabda carinulata TaxID=1163345 RepID=UPI0025A0464F|nr:uncharacterized protein LOC130898576 [Diorhabda carinulata]